MFCLACNNEHLGGRIYNTKFFRIQGNNKIWIIQRAAKAQLHWSFYKPQNPRKWVSWTRTDKKHGAVSGNFLYVTARCFFFFLSNLIYLLHTIHVNLSYSLLVALCIFIYLVICTYTQIIHVTKSATWLTGMGFNHGDGACQEVWPSRYHNFSPNLMQHTF